MKTDLFQSCGHCWVFQICWHIECSTFIASSFRIWNSSTEIASPPLALFVSMLPKIHLTSCSRMSGSRWVITPSWLSRSWSSFFVQFFCVFILFNSIVFLYFFALITEENFLISPCYSLELWIQKWYIFPSILCFLLLFFSQLFARPPQTTILSFCISFSWGWFSSLPPVQSHEPPSIVL